VDETFVEIFGGFLFGVCWTCTIAECSKMHCMPKEWPPYLWRYTHVSHFYYSDLIVLAGNAAVRQH
jgi:hypothetical protein